MASAKGTMPDYPILMAAPMVRALLEGRKTQSRRLPTPTWEKVLRSFHEGQLVRLWLREAGVFGPGLTVYRADLGPEAPPPAGARRWSPSIHMPRWASRLTLFATDVRREKLQAISDADCRAEGAIPLKPGRWREAFRDIWNSLHDRPGERWEDDPEVIVLKFAVPTENIDGAGGRAT